MDIFLKRVTPPQEGPQVGPQEVLQREGIVVPGDEGSIHAIAPGDLPVGRDGGGSP